MILQVQVRRCVPGDGGGAAQLYKLWHYCSGAMQQQAAPRHLKDKRPGVNNLFPFSETFILPRDEI